MSNEAGIQTLTSLGFSKHEARAILHRLAGQDDQTELAKQLMDSDAAKTAFEVDDPDLLPSIRRVQRTENWEQGDDPEETRVAIEFEGGLNIVFSRENGYTYQDTLHRFHNRTGHDPHRVTKNVVDAEQTVTAKTAADQFLAWYQDVESLDRLFDTDPELGEFFYGIESLDRGELVNPVEEALKDA